MREIAIVAHPHRPDAVAAAEQLSKLLAHSALEVHLIQEDRLATIGAVELIVVVGGDGTLLRTAHELRHRAIPLLGVNLGHVGFLAEAEKTDIDEVASAIIRGSYTVEERLALSSGASWALNELAFIKDGTHMVDLLVEIDGRPLSRWGCDAILVSTPTGSTAYAFSSGGPIVWPQLQCMIVTPVAAHALFARPAVVAPTSVIAVTLLQGQGALMADGDRRIPLEVDQRVEIRPAQQPVLLARLSTQPFTDRLVAKFQLPIDGWRGLNA